MIDFLILQIFIIYLHFKSVQSVQVEPASVVWLFYTVATPHLWFCDVVFVTCGYMRRSMWTATCVISWWKHQLGSIIFDLQPEPVRQLT